MPGSVLQAAADHAAALQFQDDPPKPTAAEVKILVPPSDKVVYVLQFGGESCAERIMLLQRELPSRLLRCAGFLVDDVTVDTHAKKLKQALLEDRIEFDEDKFFTVRLCLVSWMLAACAVTDPAGAGNV